MPEKKASKKPAKSSGGKAFTEEELSAVRDRVEETMGKGEGEDVVLAKIDGMKEPDRAMAKRVHTIVKTSAPSLKSRLWYGMPAYARDDKVVCFFQPGSKFKTRYSTFGFSDKANLDDGGMWPNSYAVMKLSPAEEAKIAALVKKAVS